MSPDIILGIATVLMALLGAAVSLHPPESLHDPKKWWVKLAYAGAFCLLGTIAIVCVIKQSNETVIANQNLANSITNLDSSTKEISRVTSLNTDLQHQLLGQGSRIAHLAQESLENITGGESFAVIAPQAHSGLVPIPLIIRNWGNQTLTGVTVVIRDQLAWDFFSNPYGMFQAEASALNVGTLHKEEIKTLNKALDPSTQDCDKGCVYQIEISAQNFTVTENLVFRKGKKLPWGYMYTVDRQYVKSKTAKETKFGYKILAKADWTGD